MAGIPPDTNRGVGNTEQQPLKALVDWFEVTFKYTQDYLKVCEIIGLDFSQFRQMDTGLNGYKDMIVFGNIKMMKNGSNENEMGVHVLMSGQACRQYEQIFGAYKWNVLFARIMNYMDAGGNAWFKFSRLDVAIDDIRYNGEKPYFTVKNLIERGKYGQIRSKFRTGKEIDGFGLKDGAQQGYTLYIGSGKSELSIRFYDKVQERINADKVLDNGITSWNRTELQLRNDRAYAMALYIVNDNDIGANIRGVLSNYINFVTPDKDTNKARWKVSKFWSNFLGDVAKLRLTMAAPDKTIDTARTWWENQTTKTLAKVFLANDFDLDYLKEQLDIGLMKLTDKDFEEIKLYQDRKDDLREKIENLGKGSQNETDT